MRRGIGELLGEGGGTGPRTTTSFILLRHELRTLQRIAASRRVSVGALIREALRMVYL